MAIYTCFDMITDCRQGKPEGWRHFARTFLPPLRRIVAHYGGGEEQVMHLVERLREAKSSPLNGMRPMTEREFLDSLRPLVLELTRTPVREPAPSLELVQEALAPLTAIERQTAWLETFGYPAREAARIMRMAPETAVKLRERTGELLRAKLDDWSADMLARHGYALGAEVEGQPPAEPLSYRDFFDVIDGRNTWQHRTTFERTLEESWFEVHRACRIREADDAMDKAKPLDGDALRAVLGYLRIPAAKTGFWKRVLAGK
ncbi:MAG: hypothetical protein IT164_00545 [Bryobacterales bacterium]|nr:hypothetical protein [Bryobacterales bacterium]